jgi:hypothetical protein
MMAARTGMGCALSLAITLLKEVDAEMSNGLRFISLDGREFRLLGEALFATGGGRR